ncbi:MAG: thiamine-phosphate kinase [Candidatus Baltobacteraceae bacterium]
MSEDEVVAALEALCRPASPAGRRIRLGIGDDAALWQPSRSHLSAISTDMLVENVHFTRALASLEDIGRRAMAANLSDLAAMGARPVLATIALGVPPPFDQPEILELYRGLTGAAADAKLAIAGGDLSRSEMLTVTIAIVGEVRSSNVKLRSGGRPGDVLAVTGPLGAARAGLELARGDGRIAGELAEAALLAFRRPQARGAQGRFLAASRNVRAMMDCSDGLSTDLARLCIASGCGASLESVPVAASARAYAAANGEDPERFALAGGEDFELIVAIRARAFGHLAARYEGRFGQALERIGVLCEGDGVVWDGAPLLRLGWDHFSAGSAS